MPVLVILAAVAGGVALLVAVRRKMSPVDRAMPQSEPSRAAKAAPVKSENDEGDYEDEAPGRPGMSASAKRGIVTALVIGLLVVLAFVVADQSSKSKVTGDTITKTFSSAEPCENAQIALAVDDGADPANTAETLFAAIQSVPSLTTATYNHKTKSIQIGYCESQTSEAALKQALAPTGLVSAESFDAVASALFAARMLDSHGHRCHSVCYDGKPSTRAGVAELADAPGLGPGEATHGGSSPLARTS